MYSYEQRVRAVKLLIQYDMSYATVIQELGYPNNSKTLKYWYKEYESKGDLHQAYAGGSKYTVEQKQAAVTYYLEHGRCISRACRKLGYPSREMLGQWIDELAPDQRKRCRTSSADVEYSQEIKEQAVIDLCARDGSAQEVADRYVVSRYSLYNWKRQLLDDGGVTKVKRKPKNAVMPIPDDVSELRDEVAGLKVEAESLNREIYRSEAPNEKWLTDITEFHIPAGKIYLSPIIDCFDGLPVSWTISTSPDAELVNTMLDLAIAQLKDGEHPIVHSGRGAHYRWPGWIDRMDDAELTRSMSKKGCSPDNSACEGFFGRLKNEMFYGYS